MLDAKPHILNATIDSVLNQTFTDWQLIIYSLVMKDPAVNATIEYYTTQYKDKITVVYGNKSMDVVENRNRALDIIKETGSKYFAYQELDTISYPTRFE